MKMSRSDLRQYLVSCPLCNEALVNKVARLWISRGMLVCHRYGTVVLAGCAQCVRRQIVKHMLLNAIAGWWSFYGILQTPFVLLQNAFEMILPTSCKVMEAFLRSCGIDPSAVRVNALGLSGDQQDLLDASLAAMKWAIVADGVIHDVEIEAALDLADRLVDGRLSREYLLEALLLADACNAKARWNETVRLSIVKMAFAVAAQDGSVSTVEFQFLRKLAREMGVVEAAEQIFVNMCGGGEGGGPEVNSELAWAMSVLGIDRADDIRVIKAAYRRLMLKYHPDRIGIKGQDSQFHIEKAQEVNRAYSYLMGRLGLK